VFPHLFSCTATAVSFHIATAAAIHCMQSDTMRLFDATHRKAHSLELFTGCHFVLARDGYAPYSCFGTILPTERWFVLVSPTTKCFCFKVTHRKIWKLKCVCVRVSFYYFNSALEPRMYLDHEGNCIGDISPSWGQPWQTREAHAHYRGAAHAKVLGVKWYEWRFHASQNHEDHGRWKTTRGPPTWKYMQLPATTSRQFHYTLTKALFHQSVFW